MDTYRSAESCPHRVRPRDAPCLVSRSKRPKKAPGAVHRANFRGGDHGNRTSRPRAAQISRFAPTHRDVVDKKVQLLKSARAWTAGGTPQVKSIGIRTSITNVDGSPAHVCRRHATATTNPRKRRFCNTPAVLRSPTRRRLALNGKPPSGSPKRWRSAGSEDACNSNAPRNDRRPEREHDRAS
jgi:hypothetical protein